MWDDGNNTMNRWCFILLGVFLVVAHSGCSNKPVLKPRSQIIEESKAKGVPLSSIEEDREAFFTQDKVQRTRLIELVKARAGSDVRDANYRIGPEDEIEINVFDVEELNLLVKVRGSGFINLPLIGGVQAGGLTDVELKEELQRRLSTYVKNPQVSVFVSHYGSQKVAVLGAVFKPGTYPLKKGGNSLLQVIGRAGGVTEKSGNFATFIPAELSGLSPDSDVEGRAMLALNSAEQGGLKDAGIDIYLDQVLGTSGGIPLEIPVRGGDMLIVPESGKVMIEGEVEKGGSYDMGQQFTLLAGLAAAGGITYAAKIDEIEVIREVGLNKKARLVLNLEKIATGEEKDVRLRNGDIIRIPSHSGRRLTQDTFEGITKIINFGVGGSVNLAN